MNAAVTAADPRVRYVLRKAMIARVVTVSPSGRPMIMPLWFVVLNGRIYMNNAATSPTVRNIEADPHVLLMFEGVDGEVVRMRGTARYVRGAAMLRRVVRASLPKYYLSPHAVRLTLRDLPRVPTMLRYYRERTDAGMIEVTPESYSVGPA